MRRIGRCLNARSAAGFACFTALVVLYAPDHQTAQAELRPQCGDRVIVDYLAPFKSMNPAHPPPSRRKLPFGPRNLSLVEVSFGQVIVEQGAFGYSLVLTGGHAARVRLSWRVTAKVEDINAKGRLKRLVTERNWNITEVGKARGHDFSLAIEKGLGLYRYVLEFKRLDGTVLERYSQYVRVVPRKLAVSLVVDKESYRRGERAAIQVANIGTETISFGEGGIVSIQDGSRWTPVLSIPSKGKLRATQLGPGEGGRCETLVIPDSLSAGLYRVEKTVTPLFADSRRRIVREFRVTD